MNKITKKIIELREQTTPKGSKLLDELLDLLIKDLDQIKAIGKGVKK